MSKRAEFKENLISIGFPNSAVKVIMTTYDESFPTPELGEIISYTGEDNSILIGECMHHSSTSGKPWNGITDYSIDVSDCRRANADEIEVYENRNKE